MIRILVVDDQKMVREAVKLSLEPEIDLEVVGTASNGIAAIEQVKKLQPDIVLMNMEMPGLDGASATKEITNQFINTKVLILTSYDTEEYITKSLAMGAKGYLLKNTAAQDLTEAIRNIHKGYTQISPGLLEKLLVYTDSGVILSKLKQPESRQYNITVTGVRQSTIQSPQIISDLQSNYYKNQVEIDKLNSSLNNNNQELPKLRKKLSAHAKYILIIWIFWLISMPIIGFNFFNIYHKISNIKRTAIPTERIGLDGEFSLYGIAQRVEKAFQQDPLLTDISTVYVAQEDDAIFLTGVISDAELLKRMENIAKTIDGVNKVYTNQVEIKLND